LAAGIAYSSLGFMLFLSFFCELFPLPMVEAPACGWLARFCDRLTANRPTHSIGKIGSHIQ
jgi:hypothetical protein